MTDSQETFWERWADRIYVIVWGLAVFAFTTWAVVITVKGKCL